MDTSSETLNSNIAKEDREMTNKCSLWDFASGQKENLRTYMKKNIMEKLFKCNQCDFPTVHASSLWAHLKTRL